MLHNANSLLPFDYGMPFQPHKLPQCIPINNGPCYYFLAAFLRLFIFYTCYPSSFALSTG